MEKKQKVSKVVEERSFFCDICGAKIEEYGATQIISYERGDQWEPYEENYVIHLCNDCIEKTILLYIADQKIPIYEREWNTDKKIQDVAKYFNLVE